MKATFAAGCFWGVEAAFRKLNIDSIRVGYTGGTAKNPSYEQVCSGETGHAEAVEIEFNEQKVSYKQLVETFFELHDPTQKDGQGPDHGTQYRSAIFYHDTAQQGIAATVKEEAQEVLSTPIVTEIAPAGTFYEAEAYHQNYNATHGSCAR
ncbi:MAG: peptide-methionine (S)-S-oxide reductase MsrA [Candidatus Woesearchaeota archaeon]|nr:peptide-methionine (S)-S-oxide reductase MsrA [Candidatus Woesearchaeota archaeon]